MSPFLILLPLQLSLSAADSNFIFSLNFQQMLSIIYILYICAGWSFPVCSYSTYFFSSRVSFNVDTQCTAEKRISLHPTPFLSRPLILARRGTFKVNVQTLVLCVRSYCTAIMLDRSWRAAGNELSETWMDFNYQSINSRSIRADIILCVHNALMQLKSH